MDISVAPELQQFGILFVLAATVSWGAVETLKIFINSYIDHKKTIVEPWWHKPLCRLLSIVFGTIVGVFLGSTYIEYLIGFTAGVLNTFVVMLVKKSIKNKLQS